EAGRIEALAESGKPLTWTSRAAEGVAVLEEARDAAAALAAAHPDNRRITRLNAAVHTALAEGMGRQLELDGGKYDAALPHLDHAIALYLELDAEDPDDMTARRSLIGAYFKRALIHYGLEDDD